MTPTRARPIGIVTPQFFPAVGGVEVHVARLARELARAGQAVEVITTDRGGGSPGLQLVDSIRVRRFRTVPGTGEYFVSPGLATWLFANAGRYRLLHAHSYHSPMPLLAAVAARRAHIPLVVTPHYHGGGHTMAARALHLAYRPPGHWALRQAAAVICVGHQEREQLQRDTGIHAAAVVPNGVDPVDEKMDVTRDPRAILMVARAERYKRIDLVIDALGLLPDPYTLTLVTSGPHADEVERTARDVLGMARVRTCRGLTEEQLRDEYRKAGLFASFSEREAFGMAPLEAGAAGCRLLLSDIPAHREVAEYLDPSAVAFLAAGSTPETIAARIEGMSLLEAPPAPGSLPSWGEAALAVAQVFDRVAP